MKICQQCGQTVAEDIETCPSCGHDIGRGMTTIDDFRILEVLHEGYATILCRAVADGAEAPVMLRIFTSRSGLNQKIADRLIDELEKLKTLPGAYFVKHLAIRKSQEGLWYRVSEWVAAENWGSLLASGRLKDLRKTFRLFYRIASILEGLHQIGHIMPHLILDDILVIDAAPDRFEVKIDFKISRFIDPALDRPPPMLAKLLASHPDIRNGLPLDEKSDIWALGKMFVEILSADPDVTDYRATINQLAIPEAVAVLLKLMLADDPDLRPGSMAEVADVFKRLKSRDYRRAQIPSGSTPKTNWYAILAMRQRLRLLTTLLVVFGLVAAAAWIYFSSRPKDPQERLSGFANRYASSLAFVMVDYWLRTGQTLVYRNRAEGTAFLADAAGLLLTNRHVACPWLDDKDLEQRRQQLKRAGRASQFEYRLYLWFEGAKAFQRLPGLSKSTDIENVYAIDSAYTTDGPRRLRLAGVARPPRSPHEMIKSPLGDDYAVLEIDTVPAGLKPLPLSAELNLSQISRLAPVIALGFPLGSTTQESTVNVSVTRGHVRRVFDSLIQIDSSLYRGNSGGPVIDTTGQVVGIASKVAIDWALGPVPMATLLSDIGMVLPIPGAAAFLEAVRAGKPVWNGIPDSHFEPQLEKIRELALTDQWQAAHKLSESTLGTGRSPALVTAAAMMNYCLRSNDRAGQLFDQLLVLEPHNGLAGLMRLLCDWRNGRRSPAVVRQHLAALDWRSAFEFYGYLARLLDTPAVQELSAATGYSDEERAWLRYMGALDDAKNKRWQRALTQIRQALLLAD